MTAKAASFILSRRGKTRTSSLLNAASPVCWTTSRTWGLLTLLCLCRENRLGRRVSPIWLRRCVGQSARLRSLFPGPTPARGLQTSSLSCALSTLLHHLPPLPLPPTLHKRVRLLLLLIRLLLIWYANTYTHIHLPNCIPGHIKLPSNGHRSLLRKSPHNPSNST